MTKPEKNSRKVAVAMRYEGEGAPVVTAKGAGVVAEKIQTVAEAHDIPLYDDPELARVLSKVELGDEIPVALYAAVAEVIAFAYQVSGRTAEFPSHQE